jgi:hypothetical protein
MPAQIKDEQLQIGLDQVEFYNEDRTGTIEYLLNRQPILTPELFVDP